MRRISESELILSPQGRIYHLDLLPEELADTIIMVGDPDRVGRISQHLDSIELKRSHREFVSHTGRLGEQRVSVISSGIGTDNVDIVMNELDALVNIDFPSRQVKEDLKSLKIIRVGTSGSLQAEIPVGSLLVSEYGLGLDVLGHFYQLAQEEKEEKISVLLQETLALSFRPYCVAGSKTLQAQFAQDMIAGNTITAPGFYAPQGRHLRLAPKVDNWLGRLKEFNYKGFKVTNFEMETAGYYALAQLMSHEMISLNAILANRSRETFAPNPQKIVDKLIQKVLECL